MCFVPHDAEKHVHHEMFNFYGFGDLQQCPPIVDRASNRLSQRVKNAAKTV